MGIDFAPTRCPIALRVDDVEAARAELEARGVSFAADTLDTGVCHMAHFQDPDGNALMLHHRYARARRAPAERPGRLDARAGSRAPTAARSALTYTRQKRCRYVRDAGHRALESVPARARRARAALERRAACAAVSRGNRRAFATLYERHRVVLHRYCRSIVRNDEDAQDALQSAFMRALAALQASERDIAVRPWLFRIVHNEAISLLRRRLPTDGPVDERELAHVSVERTVEERERLATLVADIQSLGERQRAALLMRELSGLLDGRDRRGASRPPRAAAKQALFEARCALHELAEGRAMECETVRQRLSERDGRVLRGRKVRAHLRACVSCVQFRAVIETRGADLRALVPPLPAAAAIGILARAAELGAGPAGEALAVSGASLAARSPARCSPRALRARRS